MKPEQIAALLRIPRLPSDLLACDAALAEDGYTPRQIEKIRAVVELGRTAILQAAPERRRIVRAGDAAAILRPVLSGLECEEFWCVLLDLRLRFQARVRISSGGQAQCSVSVAESLAPAVRAGARAVIFAHNHPSGDCAPSAADRNLAELLDAGGKLLGVKVTDHLIIARGAFYSHVEGYADFEVKP